MREGRYIPVALEAVMSRFGVLLARRADLVPPVAFPGGRFKPGEAPMEAAGREVLEETGLRVEALFELGRRDHPQTNAELIYVACSTIDGREPQPALREVAAVGWYALDEALELLPELHKPVTMWLVPRPPRRSGPDVVPGRLITS